MRHRVRLINSSILAHNPSHSITLPVILREITAFKVAAGRR